MVAWHRGNGQTCRAVPNILRGWHEVRSDALWCPDPPLSVGGRCGSAGRGGQSELSGDMGAGGMLREGGGTDQLIIIEQHRIHNI